MKRVGIITLYDEINIGNKLQNFAVQYFFEGMGYECETIRHWEMAHKEISVKSLKLSIIRLLGYPKKSAQKLRLEKKRKKRFKSFTDSYLKIGPEVRINNLPKDLCTRYDYFVTGSDQVWHNWTNSKAELDYFFLQFAKRFQRLTIAPSFGKASVEQDLVDDYSRGLSGIPVITCREKQGAEIVNKLTNQEAKVILDPTMLIDEKIWVSIEKKPEVKIPGKYILVYALGNRDSEIQNYIDNLAVENDLSVIDIYNPNMPELFMTTPDEFLYYIHHAELVITDSFHACVFSILFKTDFVVFDRKTKSMGNMTSRLDTLLEAFNLSNRKLINCNKDMLFNTDFSSVDSTLHKEREQTKELYRETFELLEKIRLKQKEG